MTLYMRCRINHFLYNRVQLYSYPLIQILVYILTDSSALSFGVYSTTSYNIVQWIVFILC